ncbi:MAG: alpha/beta hydrolase [Coriobacteriales bacterium]|nr:alpha/beta hydrolase [Coriobacteriales bacterium]
MPKINWSNGYVRNGDAALYYEVHQSSQKNAPLLVCLHGNGENMHIFDGHIEPLLPYYTIITMDTRAQGKSSPGDRPLSYALFAEDLFTLINKLQIGSVLLLGFSDGGNTALELALQHQERVAAMILVGANLSPDGMTSLARTGLQLRVAAQRLKSLFSKGAGKEQELLRLMLEYPRIDPQQLEKVAVPTLVISGERDVIKDEHSELIAQSLPNARRVAIPGAGHFVMKDAPTEFDRIVLEFLMEDD